MPTLASIVLAGGRGQRLASVTGGVPKQFWAPPGSRSLLEETHARIAPLTDPIRTVTVVDNSHRTYVEALRPRGAMGQFVYQPADRGTAAGLLLAATMVSIGERDAVVVVTPSDHGVQRPEGFRSGILAAAAHVQARPTDVVLLGVQASSAQGDYGWIVPARPPVRGASPVVSFVEKPAPAVAERLFAAGGVWNTMVLVAKVEALFDLYRRHAPDLAAAFELFRFVRPAVREERIARLYQHLPAVDFSRDVLARADGLQCLTWDASIGWTDLGTPERLEAWLTRTRTTREPVRSEPVLEPVIQPAC